MIEISEDNLGATISLRVQPKASADRLAGEHAGALKVSVTAPAESGKANGAVIKLLSGKLRVPKSSITITAGRTSRQKRIHVSGMKADEMRRLLNLAS